MFSEKYFQFTHPKNIGGKMSFCLIILSFYCNIACENCSCDASLKVICLSKINDQNEEKTHVKNEAWVEIHKISQVKFVRFCNF